MKNNELLSKVLGFPKEFLKWFIDSLFGITILYLSVSGFAVVFFNDINPVVRWLLVFGLLVILTCGLRKIREIYKLS